jgi:hypothetical protein
MPHFRDTLQDDRDVTRERAMRLSSGHPVTVDPPTGERARVEHPTG